MDNLREMIETVRRLGYENEADIRARVCQDLVLEAITKSSLRRNVTIKGGVVMRSITGNIRRATQDMDIWSISLFLKAVFTSVFCSSMVNSSHINLSIFAVNSLFLTFSFFYTECISDVQHPL